MGAGTTIYKGLGRRKHFDSHIDLGYSTYKNYMIEYYISPNYVKLFNDPPRVVINRFLRRCMLFSPYILGGFACYCAIKFSKYGVYYNKTKHYNIMGIPEDE